MSGKLKVVFKNDQKQVKVETGTRILLRRCCHAVLENEEFQGSAQIGIEFLDKPSYTSTGSEFRGIQTDPEAFSVVYEPNADDAVQDLGKVIISIEEAKTMANSLDSPFRSRLAFLTAHCVMELLGYPERRSNDHIKNRRVAVVLSRLGVNYV